MDDRRVFTKNKAFYTPVNVRSNFTEELWVFSMNVQDNNGKLEQFIELTLNNIIMITRDKLNTFEKYQSNIDFDTNCIVRDLQEYVKNRECWDAERIHSQMNDLIRRNYQVLISKYSAGYPVPELISDYVEGVRFMRKGWKENSDYITMLWYLSMGVMLECHQEMQQLSELLKEHSVKDKLFSFLINNDSDYLSEPLLWSRPYGGLIEVIELSNSNKGKTVERLQQYLKKEWYKGHSDCGWYNDHKSKWGVHFGYWSFESGALVKKLGLDDNILKEQQYYPYDMVHWKDQLTD